jgi:hypothetical protein
MKSLLVTAAYENQRRAPVRVCDSSQRHASILSGPAAALVICDFDVMDEMSASDVMSGKSKADQVRGGDFKLLKNAVKESCCRLFTPSRN